MELIQFSTLTCPPCKMAKEYIERNFDVNLINYTFVTVENLDKFDPKYKQILSQIRSRSVPLFVVTENDEIVYTFVGFNKQEISTYAEYIVKNSKNKIKDNIPEELEQKIIRIENMLSGDEFDKPKLNGHSHYDEDDYIDDDFEDEDYDDEDDLEDYLDD